MQLTGHSYPSRQRLSTHAEADTHHAPAPCHTLSEVQPPPRLHSQPSLAFQAAASHQSVPEDCMTDNSQSVLKVRIVTS